MRDMRIIELVEYQPVLLPVTELPVNVATLLSDQYRAKVGIERSLTGEFWRLTNLGWVGFLPLTDSLALSLTPKVTIGRLFEMLEVAYDLRVFENTNELHQVASVADLYERLAGELARQVLARLRRGIYRSYVGMEEQSACVRGRLDVRRQMMQPWRVEPHCHFEEHTADLEENQLLLWTLQQILRSGICHEDRELPIVRRAYHTLLSVTTPTPFPAHACRNRIYHRLNEDYAPLHALCFFFLAHAGPSHELGDQRMVPFLVNMASLFELFVAQWLRQNLGGPYTVSMQESYHLGAGSETKFVIDLVIRNDDKTWVLDTKYKTPDNAATDDIAQVVAYAESMGTNEGVLVYPRALPKADLFRVGATTIRALAFDIDGHLGKSGEQFLAALLHDSD